MRILSDKKKEHSIILHYARARGDAIFCMDFHFSMEAAEHSLLDFVLLFCPTRTGLEPPELARPRLAGPRLLPPVECRPW